MLWARRSTSSCRKGGLLLDGLRHFDHADARLSLEAVDALGKLGPEAVEPIITFIKEGERRVYIRGLAARGLANLGFHHPEMRERIAGFFKEMLVLVDGATPKEKELVAIWLTSVASCIDDPGIREQIKSVIKRENAPLYSYGYDLFLKEWVGTTPWSFRTKETDLMDYFGREHLANLRKEDEEDEAEEEDLNPTNWTKFTEKDLIERLVWAGIDLMSPGLPEAVVGRGETIVEPLCSVLLDKRGYEENPKFEDRQDEEEEWGWARWHAFILLGLIGSSKAVNSLLDYFRLEIDSDYLITHSGAKVLGSLDAGAVEPIIEYIGQSGRRPIYRCVAAEGLVEIGFRHPEARERIAGFFKEYLAGAKGETPDDLEFNGWLAMAAAAIDDEEVKRLLEAVIKRGLVDPFIYDMDSLRLDRTERPPWSLGDLGRELWYYFSQEFFDLCLRIEKEDEEDALKKEHEKPAPDHGKPLPSVDHLNREHSPPAEPRRRKETKIGRNDPCPCGSGKKYKKCCLYKK